MMTDPLSELESSLAYMFELQTGERGKYISPLVRGLKKALDSYKNDPTGLLFRALFTAIKKALPMIEDYVDTYTVKVQVEALAKAKGEHVGWGTATKFRRYPLFQFAGASCRSEANDFMLWLSDCVGKDITNLDTKAQAEILLVAKARSEFTAKLAKHLRAYPDFLLNLVMASSHIFIKVMNSCIGFHLEKQQIAKAIRHHSSTMVDDSLDSLEQVDNLVDFLDKNLCVTGCSIEKLLRNPLAKAELDKSTLFQLYQSTDFSMYKECAVEQLKR
jgi:hypothetical protein